MKLARVKIGNEEMLCRLEDGALVKVNGDMYNVGCDTDEKFQISDVEFLPPVTPSKIVAIGKNYHAHAVEMNDGEPTEPLIFLKPNTCIVAHESNVIYPQISKRVDYEGELGVVIGKKCKYAAQHNALEYVLGYTCLNDITARDIQKSDSQWTRGKAFDTFCPIGPYVVTRINAADLKITTRLNGIIKQNSRTSCMTHSIPELIAYISRVMTLLPGDIIATGTPAGIGAMDVGDTIEIEIEQIGVLRNQIVAENLIDTPTK